MTTEQEQGRGNTCERITITVGDADKMRLLLIRYVAARHWPASVRITTSELIRWALLLAVDSLKEDGFIPETEVVCPDSPST